MGVGIPRLRALELEAVVEVGAGEAQSRLRADDSMPAKAGLGKPMSSTQVVDAAHAELAGGGGGGQREQVRNSVPLRALRDSRKRCGDCESRCDQESCHRGYQPPTAGAATADGYSPPGNETVPLSVHSAASHCCDLSFFRGTALHPETTPPEPSHPGQTPATTSCGRREPRDYTRPASLHRMDCTQYARNMQHLCPRKIVTSPSNI
jgi:hypothetical protein